MTCLARPPSTSPKPTSSTSVRRRSTACSSCRTGSTPTTGRPSAWPRRQAPTTCRPSTGSITRHGGQRDHQRLRRRRPAVPRQDPGSVDYTQVTSAFRTILFTDLEGSTALLNEVGEPAYLVALTEHDLIIRRALVASRGREVKRTGDGIMASFDDVARALGGAAAIQDGLDARTAGGATPDLRVRIGIAAGEPVDHNDDMFGSTVDARQPDLRRAPTPAASSRPTSFTQTWAASEASPSMAVSDVDLKGSPARSASSSSRIAGPEATHRRDSGPPETPILRPAPRPRAPAAAARAIHTSWPVVRGPHLRPGVRQVVLDR